MRTIDGTAMRIFRRDFRLLWIGLAATAVSLIFGFTPLLWMIKSWLWGVEPHDYPEIFWIFVALPMSLGVVLAGIVYAWIVLNPFGPPDPK
ncbi:MAG TPA: hypothetical protein VHN20_14145 [Beijerinckiaceae bacterium]|nr:hypothetical protein [Beijerinckiaceae bacterium]